MVRVGLGVCAVIMGGGFGWDGGILFYDMGGGCDYGYSGGMLCYDMGRRL